MDPDCGRGPFSYASLGESRVQVPFGYASLGETHERGPISYVNLTKWTVQSFEVMLEVYGNDGKFPG